jgi:carbonic anhydrase
MKMRSAGLAFTVLMVIGHTSCGAVKRALDDANAEIRKISPVLAGLERDKKMLMVGSMYQVETGQVEFLS